MFSSAAMDTSWAAEHCRQELHCCRKRRKCCQSRKASRLRGVKKAEKKSRGRLSTEQGFEGMLSHKNISRWTPFFVSAVQQSLRAGLLYRRNTVDCRAAKWLLPSTSNNNVCLPTVQTIPKNHFEPHLVNITPPLLHLLIEPSERCAALLHRIRSLVPPALTSAGGGVTCCSTLSMRCPVQRLPPIMTGCLCQSLVHVPETRAAGMAEPCISREAVCRGSLSAPAGPVGTTAPDH